MMSFDHSEMSDFDLSQNTILEKLILYCEMRQRDPELIAKLKGPGYCSGITALTLYALWLQTQPLSKNILQRDDWSWLKNVFSFLLTANRENLWQLEEKKGINNVERLLSLIESFQKVEEYTPAGHGELQESLSDTRQRHLFKQFAIGGAFVKEDFKKNIIPTESNDEKKISNKQVSLLDAIIQEGTLVLITSHNHDTGVFKLNGKFYYFDPNKGLKIFVAEEQHAFIDTLFNANFPGFENNPSPLAFRVFTFEQNPKLKFVEVNTILEILTLNKYGKDLANFSFAHANKYSPIHRAAWAGSLSSVDYYIKLNADFTNAKTNNGCTPLYFAAWQGHLEIVNRLLEQKRIEIDARDSEGNTPLYMAVENGQLNVVKKLIEKKAEVNAQCNNFYTPLYAAVKKGNAQLVNLLLESKANINLESKISVLFAAAENGHVEIVKRLLAEKASPQIGKLEDGYTPLMVASANGFSFTAETLLENKADINLSAKNDTTALHEAIKNKRVPLANQILKLNANINAVDANGATPFLIAVEMGLDLLAATLLEKKAHANPIRTSDGYSPFLLAVANGNQSLVKSLIEDYKSDINLLTKDGSSALHIAIQKGHIQIAEMLLKAGIKPDVADNTGATPLFLAAEKNSKALVNQLITEYKVNINAKTRDNTSVLSQAIAYGHDEVTNTLLQYNAEVKVADKDGTTPIWLATTWGNEALVKTLLEKKADIHKKTNEGAHVLHVAAMKGNLNLIKLFIDLGLGINSLDEKYQNPLCYAVKNGQLAAAKMLIENKAELNSKELHPPPLHLAIQTSSAVMVETLLKSAADVNFVEEKGSSPLKLASALDNDTLLKNILQQSELNLDFTSSDGSTALSTAIQHEKIKNVELLLKARADLSLDQALLATWHAVLKGNLPLVKLLIDNKANVNFFNSNSKVSLLAIALQSNKVEIASLLINANANPNIADNKGETPLHIAARKGLVDMVKVLISQGADTLAETKQGATPYSVAIDNGAKGALEFKRSNAELFWLQQQISHIVEFTKQKEPKYANKAEFLQQDTLNVLNERTSNVTKFYTVVKTLRENLNSAIRIYDAVKYREMKRTAFFPDSPAETLFYNGIYNLLREIDLHLSPASLNLPKGNFKKIPNFPDPIPGHDLQTSLNP